MNCILQTGNTTGDPSHYINWPFKPEGQPASVQVREPDPVNILTALAENESVVKNENDTERRVIASTVRHKPDRMSYADLVITCHETSNRDYNRTL